MQTSLPSSERHPFPVCKPICRPPLPQAHSMELKANCTAAYWSFSSPHSAVEFGAEHLNLHTPALFNFLELLAMSVLHFFLCFLSSVWVSSAPSREPKTP